MRIGIDATSVLDELTGVEVHVLTAVDALAGHAGRDDEFVAFVRRRPPQDWSHLPPNFRVVLLDTDSQVLATQVLLPRAIRRAQLDVLYCPGKPPPALAGCPVLTTVHDAIPWTHPHTMGSMAAVAWYRSFWRLAVARGAHVATDTEASATQVRSVLPVSTERLHVVGCALAPWLAAAAVDSAPPWEEAGPGPYLLSLCRTDPRRDLGTVLDAWELLRSRYPELTLVLAGQVGWKVGDVVDRARSMERVRVTGEVPTEHLAGLYRHASAFVSASLVEGFGLPVLEAMALGTPVVVSAIPAHEEVVAGAGEVFPTGSPELLAAALDLVLGDPRRREEMVSRGRQRARHFSAEGLATRLRAALERTVGPAAPAP